MQNTPGLYHILHSDQSDFQKLLHIKATLEKLENGNLLFLFELFEHYKRCLMSLNSSVNSTQEVYRVAILNLIQRFEMLEAVFDKNGDNADKAAHESSIRESMIKELDYLCKQLDSFEN